MNIDRQPYEVFDRAIAKWFVRPHPTNRSGEPFVDAWVAVARDAGQEQRLNELIRDRITALRSSE